MNVTRHLTLALGLAAILAAPVLAQQRPGGQGPGRFGGAGLGMGMGRQGSLLQTVMAPPVHEELALSDEQIEKIRPIGEQLRSDMMGRMQGLRDLSPEERSTRLEQLAREMDDKAREQLKGILKDEQLARLEQIRLQQQGVQAFTDPRIQDELKLSDEQKAEVSEILASYRDEIRTLMERARDSQDRGALMGEMAEVRRSSMDKAMGVLSDDQVSSWKEMTGEPFEMGPGRFGRGFGPGGPGGRRPGQR